jgi:hypothetical protein
MSENTKYELTDVSIEWMGKTLFQIKALKSFWNVEVGELGGYIEKEENLSFFWDAWIYWNAIVYWDAQVFWNAWIYWNSKVYWDAQVFW